MGRLSPKSRRPAHPTYQKASWQPPLDIYQVGEAWLLKLDLAGVEQQDIRIFVEGRRIVISGERRDLAVAQCCRAYQMEIAYNQFERAVQLPVELDPTNCECEYVNGMLLVTLHPLATSGGGNVQP